jgi:hypothetical protein
MAAGWRDKLGAQFLAAENAGSRRVFYLLLSPERLLAAISAVNRFIKF